MDYIISKEQSERLRGRILEYINKNLTPYYGWKSLGYYKNQLKKEDSEIFFFLVPSLGSGEDHHMWYSLCNNPNAEFEKGECPVVRIPNIKYDVLESFFGGIWKPVFMEWFKQNTKLPLVKVDKLDWQ